MPEKPTTSGCSPEQVQAILGATDWVKHDRQTDWVVEGKLLGCSCIMCPAYYSWIERGKKIYGPTEQEKLGETLNEIETHRANVRAGIEYNRSNQRKARERGLVSAMASA